MEQTKALNALEPFLALTKSATSARAAADLITRATSHPNTFLFTELLQTPQIQSLAQAEAEYSAYLTLLKIFSYGTYQDYQQQQAKQTLPPLNDAQTLKLRQLSLLTLARDRSNLTYETLQVALGLISSRMLEDLVISAVYAGLVEATLDPSRQAVQVNRVAPLRDLAPGAIPPMISALQAWSNRCTATLSDLEKQIAGIRDEAERRQRAKEAWDAKLNKMVEDAKENPADFGLKKLPLGFSSGALHKSQRYGKRGSGVMDAGGEGVDDEAMDVDDDDDEAAEGKKRASRRKL